MKKKIIDTAEIWSPDYSASRASLAAKLFGALLIGTLFGLFIFAISV